MVSITQSGVSTHDLKQHFAALHPEIKRLQEALRQHNYNSDYASLNLPHDHDSLAYISTLIEEKKRLDPAILVVIGIGGSNLGTLALQEALFGKLNNDKDPNLKIYYADTVDSDYIFDILEIVTDALKCGKTIMLNGVTKSGTTTETIANFEIFLQTLMHYHPHDYEHYVVITTDKDSKLWNIAQKEKFALLEVPQKVGGRYSVFSAVGLFPLGLLGCDIGALLQGAADSIKNCTALDFDENYAAQTACVLYAQHEKNITIQDMFLFSVQLEGVGKWYRQLMGESIGKEFNRKNEKVETGITPTVSMGTVDLHSVGQLYLGGPRDKGTTFVSIRKSQHNLTIPHFDLYDQAVEKIQGKSLELLMHATLQGVQAAYIKNNRPFMAIELPECSEYYLGHLLQYKMVEMIYLGFLLEVNPFDQPNVESYKLETRRILASL